MVKNTFKGITEYLIPQLRGSLLEAIEDDVIGTIQPCLADEMTLNDIFAKDGFEVYGMEVNESVFRITLQPTSEFESLQGTVPKIFLEIESYGDYEIDFQAADNESVRFGVSENQIAPEITDEFSDVLNEIREQHLLIRLKH